MIYIFYEHILEGCGQRSISEEEGLRLAQGYGITGLECDLWRLRDRDKKLLFDDCGIRVRSVYQMFTREQVSEGRLTADLLETASFYGARKVLVIPALDTPLPDAADMLSAICEKAKGYGITAMIEDYDDVRSPCCRSDDIAFLLENVTDLGAVFDTGNFAYCLEDELDALERFTDRVVHVHLKDRSRTPSGEGKEDTGGQMMYPSPVGSGYIRTDMILDRLSAAGYGGDFTIEHFGARDQFETMRASADHLHRKGLL